MFIVNTDYITGNVVTGGINCTFSDTSGFTELKIFGIDKLPRSLNEAAREFEKDAYIQEVLGEDLSRKYIEAKTREYQEYRGQVTEWELSKYLHLL